MARTRTEPEPTQPNPNAHPTQALAQLKGSLATRLSEYTSFDTDVALLSLKMKALVMDLIHHIDVVDQLMGAGCYP